MNDIITTIEAAAANHADLYLSADEAVELAKYLHRVRQPDRATISLEAIADTLDRIQKVGIPMVQL